MPTIFARFCRAALCTLALAGSSACSDNSISDPQLDPEASGENRTVANALTVNITDVQTASGYRYVVATGLADSVEAYIDRPWVYDNVPRFLQGATYIRTRQQDRTLDDPVLLSFRIDREAVVFLAVDPGFNRPWLEEIAGFKPVRDNLYIPKQYGNGPGERSGHLLYAKVYPAKARVVLGPNRTDGGDDMYTVIVRPVGDGVLSAGAGGPYSAAAGTMVQFVGTAEAAPQYDLALSYTWDFGDGHTGVGPRPSHTYESPGSYTARFEVTDAMGNTVTATAPVSIGSSEPYAVSQVSTGDGYACAVRASGVVNCWGRSDYGEAPAEKRASVGRFVQVAAHKDHTCALRDDGAVECWGNNVDGRAPALETAWTGVFTQVDVGEFHSCALRDDGRWQCWGPFADWWVSPVGQDRGYYTQLAFGNRHVCAVRTDGAVLCRGWHRSVRQPTSGKFVQVTAGQNHTCALRDDGVVECWYLNQFGQAPPTRSASRGRFVAVEAGATHTCGLRDDGVVECWGGNGWGQAPATQTASVGTYRQLSGGYYFNCAVRSDHALECWGKNRDREARSEQRIVFTSLPPMGYVGGSYPIVAEGGASGNPVELTSLTPEVCTVSEGMVSADAPGTCTVAANQAGNWRYFPAPEVRVSFQVEAPQAAGAGNGT